MIENRKLNYDKKVRIRTKNELETRKREFLKICETFLFVKFTSLLYTIKLPINP